ncbi:MAG: DUF2877 domain-containing protein [Thermodesulfobacteriota bacterium]
MSPKGIPPNLLQAEAIGYKALKELLGNPTKKSRVLSVFEHAFYLQTQGSKLINVIQNRNYISPTSILVNGLNFSDFKSAGIREGMQVDVKDNKIEIDGGLFVINLDDSSTWFTPRIPKKRSIKDLRFISLNLRVLRDVIYECKSREGLVPLLERVELGGPVNLFLNPLETSFSERARPNIERLMWGLYWGDSEMFSTNAQTILGLGPGLTPSCDDFLAGLMISLDRGVKVLLKDEKAFFEFLKGVFAEIAEESKARTTIYSQGFLKLAHKGEGNEIVVKLVHSLLTDHEDSVASYSKTLIEMGETSGADIAIGIYYGIRFLISRLENLEVLDQIK